MKSITWLTGSAIELDVRISCIKKFSFLEIKRMLNSKGYDITEREYNNIDGLIDEEIGKTLRKTK